MVGCTKEMPPATIAGAESAYDEAEKLYSAKNYAAAAEKYAIALQSGGLHVDLYVTAQLHRAESLARTGNFDLAHSILIELEQGAPDMAAVHATRCFTFQKQGKQTEANEQFRIARQYNPAIQMIPD